MKSGYGIVYRLTQAQIDAGEANNIIGARIEVTDGSGLPTGTVYESGGAGISPTLLVSSSGSGGAGGYEKVQILTANYDLKPSTSGLTRIFHIEAGGTLSALTVASWPIPSAPQKFEIQNHSGVDQTFTVSVGAGQFSGMVDFDNNDVEDNIYVLKPNTMVGATVDQDGWVQVSPIFAGYTKQEVDAALATKAALMHTHAQANVTNLVADLTTLASVDSANFESNLILVADGTSTTDWASVEGSGQTLTTATVDGSSRFSLTSTANGAMGYKKIAIDDKARYLIRLKIKGSAARVDGLYIRMNERASDTTDTHITFANRTSTVDMIGYGPVPGTFEDKAFTYIPTTGTKWASFSVYHWWAGGETLYFDDVEVRKVVGSGMASITSLTNGSVSALFDALRFNRVTNIDTTDLDALTVSGFYDGTNLTNRPTGVIGGWFFVVHLQHSNSGDTGWRTQLAKGLNPVTGWYIRSRTSAGWGAWTALSEAGHAHAVANITGLQTALDGKAPIVVSGTIDANNDGIATNTLHLGNDTGAITNGPTTAWAWALWNLRFGNWRYQMVWNGNGVYFRSSNAAFTGSTWTQLQTQLISGTDIKTVNGQSLLGAGNLAITGGGQVSPLLAEARYWYSADTYDFVNNTGPNLGAGGQPITGLATKLPTIASINGRPAWGMYVSTTDSKGLTAPNQMGTTQAVEVFFVKKHRNSAAEDYLFNLNGQDTTSRITAHFPWMNGDIYWDCGSADASGRLTKTAAGITENEVYIGGVTGGPGEQSIRKNGAILASDANISTLTFTGGLRMGYGTFTNALAVSGDVAEIIIFNRVLTTNERAFVEGYLAKKYGVTLTSGHLFA